MAESLLDDALPQLPDELYLEYRENGNRTNYEQINDKRLAMMNILALAECLEYRGRFLQKLEEWLGEFFCQKSWVLPAHDYDLMNFNDKSPFPDLAASDAACMLAYIDWFLQEKLRPATRERMRRETMHRALAPYQRAIRGEAKATSRQHWWMTSPNNWNAVCTCNLLATGLILIESRRDRAELLAAMEQSSKFFLKGFTSDGYCSEGLGYWAYGFGRFMTMGEIVLDATNGSINLFECDHVIRKCCEYPRNIMIEEGVSPAYADCIFNEEAGEGNLAIIQRHFPELLPRSVSKPTLPCTLEEFKFYLRNLREVALFAFADDMPADASTLAPLPPVSFFQEAGVLICRSTGQAGDRFGASIKGGHNAELHNHNDVGSYVIVANSSPLAADYGGEVYTRRTFSKDRYQGKMLNSYGHDVPVVAAQLQKVGREAEGVIRETCFTDELSSILLDMTSCYDVKELVSLTRRFAFDHVHRRVVITDTVEYSSPQIFEDAILTNGDYHIASKSQIRLFDEKNSLTATISVSGADWTIEGEHIDNTGKISPTRLAIRLDRPVLKATFKCIFKPEGES